MGPPGLRSRAGRDLRRLAARGAQRPPDRAAVGVAHDPAGVLARHGVARSGLRDAGSSADRRVRTRRRSPRPRDVASPDPREPVRHRLARPARPAGPAGRARPVPRRRGGVGARLDGVAAPGLGARRRRAGRDGVGRPCRRHGVPGRRRRPRGRRAPGRRGVLARRAPSARPAPSRGLERGGSRRAALCGPRRASILHRRPRARCC